MYCFFALIHHVDLFYLGVYSIILYSRQAGVCESCNLTVNIPLHKCTTGKNACPLNNVMWCHESTWVQDNIGWVDSEVGSILIWLLKANKPTAKKNAFFFLRDVMSQSELTTLGFWALVVGIPASCRARVPSRCKRTSSWWLQGFGWSRNSRWFSDKPSELKIIM